jgi:hypothetical protein
MISVGESVNSDVGGSVGWRDGIMVEKWTIAEQPGPFEGSGRRAREPRYFGRV